mmetsp:Transcript_6711/g.19865  ORF Transcript_6711/g.19865 Transcript_6711/m.19865 type:complete len:105 (+) Transcript_6711:3856-4170(+)
MFNGNFVSRNGGLPGNFSIFGFPGRKPAKEMWTFEKAMEAHVQALEGKGRDITGSGEGADRAEGPSVFLFFPEKRDELKHQFNNTAGVLFEVQTGAEFVDGKSR